jgi:iduronate 2-sulfatase
MKSSSLLRPVAAACFAAFATSLAAAPKPNVLFICVDDLKPLLGCYGDQLVKSPHIDRLAARGVRFDLAYTNQAVCAPSRNALMTGRRPTTLGIYDLPTNFRHAAPDAVTVSQHFMRHGWRAEAMGKIFHVGHGNSNDAASWTVPHWSPKAGSQYALPASTRNMRPNAQTPRGPAVECADVPDTRFGDGLIAEEAVQRLRAAKQKPDTPFFIAVGFLKPHLPFVAPKKYWDLYRRSDFKVPARETPPDGAPAFAPTTWGELRAYSDVPPTGPLTDAQKLELIHGYHAAVSYMDAQLGRVLDELDRLDLAKSTIITFWGDHGWHLGDHGMWCKHTNYEHAARIPFIVCAPGQGGAAGRSSRALVESVDLYPTLCELAGLPVPAGLDGRSFAPTLRNPNGATKPAVFHCYPRTGPSGAALIGRAVRTDRYRLVEWKPAGAPADTAVLELYDYRDDPEETRNLADARPAIVAELRALLAAQPEAKPQLKVATADTPAPTKKAKGKKAAN